MEQSSNTEQSSDHKESFKEKHGYSIITAIIIALVTCGYLFYILPKNEAKENAKNIATLEGIKQQLNNYIDDQVKYISTGKIDTLGFSSSRNSKDFYIDNITINKDKCSKVLDGKLTLPILIKFSAKYGDPKDDIINIDLAKFLNKINSTTQFTSFYICPIENGACLAHRSFPSQNVSLVDQDSLIKNNRKNGPFNFKNSTKRYYADQIKIPNTNYSILLAAGIDNAAFQTSIRQIDTALLIFCLVLIVILILGINFIKPIVSSYKERLSQTDLVGVAFSIGILIAVLVAFGVLYYWNDAIENRNKNDLKELVEKIDINFKDQIKSYQDWTKNPIFSEEWKNSKNEFAKIYLQTGPKINSLNQNLIFEEKWKNSKNPFWQLFLDMNSKTTSVNGESLTKKDSLLLKQQKAKIIKKSDLIYTADLKKLTYLDHYFRMNNEGLITTDLSTSEPEIRRKYADRMYFKTLQQKNTDDQNTDKTIDNLLTAVFSREDYEYQWIYAQKNQISEGKGIKGIAFREYFSEKIILPHGTDYMLIDRNGDVLMQSDTEKNLYQNLLNVSNKSLELRNLLSGIEQKSFEIEYQGTPYQVYAKKLDAKIDFPVYILGIRDLSHRDRLSIFTFSNGFLISLFYGFFILVITYLYSALFYAGRVSLFSNHHVYHLFPDNSRTYQYKQLLIINSSAVLLTIIVSLLSSPSIAFISCIIVGINLVLINLITLNIRTFNPKKELGKLVLILFILVICLFFVIFFYNNLSLAIFILFSTHAALIFYYRDWRKGNKKNLQTFKIQNKGVNRKAYTRFLTARLIYHFAVFPFVLISALYVSELNDFARYYCSSNQVKEQNIKNKKDFKEKDNSIITNAYGCRCDSINVIKEQPLILPYRKDDVIQKADLGFLDRPAMFEIKNFTFNFLKNKYYLNSKAILQNEMDNNFPVIFSLLIGLFFLVFLVYHLLNYYSNRFFFYDLMQAAHEKYYPCTKNILANDHIFIPMVNNDDIKELIQINTNKKVNCPDRDISINKIFDADNDNEIPLFLRMDFIITSNNKEFANEYNFIWKSLPNDDETRSVLYDFAQDHFANYKNKDIIMSLMESGIIDCHQLTGRLKIMSLSFRIFILSKSKQDKFITKFKDESKNGTFSKLKLPIFIVAISALVLLMYLNKDSYDKVAVMGGSIVSVIALINKFLEANKSL